MSRRPPTNTANRTAENAQTLKTLVKIESNKTCADCKRNKHPRWASWNLGIFICIRCSGIHRGMGTHISRVKSVDLDSWTDEQTASMVKWGNTRANKYWEAKLAPGHVPAEAKIENFIRTKYDSKRWAMDGPMPDPLTLGDDGGDDVPLSAVQEKIKAAPPRPASTASQPTLARPPVNVDLFGDDPIPQRPTTTAPAPTKPAPPPKADLVAPKVTKPADSLLGFDFFGSAQNNPPARVTSAATAPSASGPSRPDLKQSILSLYSKPSAPAAAPQAVASPASPSAQPSSNFSSLNDAFGGLNFGGASAQPQTANPSAFSNLASPPAQQRGIASPPTSTTRPSVLGGGSFFDNKPAPKPGATTIASSSSKPAFSGATSGFGDFASASSPSWGAPAQTSATNGMNDLFDLTAPASNPVTSKPAPTTSHVASPFNLSTPVKPQTQSQVAPTATSANNGFQSMGMDPWGSSNAWASSTPAPAVAPVAQPKAQPTVAAASDGWGEFSSSTQPAQVTADEDFGGWESSAPAARASAPTSTMAAPAQPKPAGGFGDAGGDLFGNVWE